jgi:hypothetical protein
MFANTFMHWPEIYKAPRILEAGYTDIINYALTCRDEGLAFLPEIMMNFDETSASRLLEKTCLKMGLETKLDLKELVLIITQSIEFDYKIPIKLNLITNKWELKSYFSETINTLRSISRDPKSQKGKGVFFMSENNSLVISPDIDKIFSECPFFYYNLFWGELSNLKSKACNSDIFYRKLRSSKYLSSLEYVFRGYERDKKLELRKAEIRNIIILIFIIIIVIIGFYLFIGKTPWQIG